MRNIRTELGKLIAYAKAHGVSVFFHQNKDGGGWTLDGREIYISAKTPLAQYLILLHECAHHRQFIQDGHSLPFKIEKAYRKESFAKEGEVLDKKYRKILYESEKNDSRHQLDIHYETRSTVPVNIVKMEIEFDLWLYKVYWKTGDFPSVKERKEYRKSLTKKWKSGRVK